MLYVVKMLILDLSDFKNFGGICCLMSILQQILCYIQLGPVQKL